MVFQISCVTVVVVLAPDTVVGSGTGTTIGLVVGSNLLPDLRMAEQQGGSFLFPLQIHLMRLGFTLTCELPDRVAELDLDSVDAEPAFGPLESSPRIVDPPFELRSVLASVFPIREELALTFVVGGFSTLGLTLVILVDTLVLRGFLLDLSFWLDSDRLEPGLLGRTLVTVVDFLTGRLALLGFPFLADLDGFGAAPTLVGLTLWIVVATTVRDWGLVFSLTDEVLLRPGWIPKATSRRARWHRMTTAHSFIVIW